MIVDLCCGTGALGLAVAQTGLAGGWAGSLHAADLDPAAVACARRNVEPAGGHVYVGDLFGALPDGLRGRADILICNAPYVPTGDVAFLPAEARDHEPLVALDGGLDGLAILRRAASGAPGWLAPGGVLLVETSDRQAPGDGGRDGRRRPLPVHPHRRRLGRHRRHRPGSRQLRVCSGRAGPGQVRGSLRGEARDRSG